MSGAPPERIPYFSAESWEAARNYASLIGEVPNSFSTLVRSQVGEFNKGLHSASVSAFQMKRMLRSEGLAAVVYFAGLTYAEDRIQAEAKIGRRQLARIFPPLDMAAVIASTYYYRTARKLVKADDWEKLLADFAPRLDIAGFVGFAIPNVGMARAILSISMPAVGASLFLKHDPKGFTEYRRMLKSKKLREAPEYEMKRWGCTVSQSASILIQSAGFGVTFAGHYAQGMSPEKTVDQLEEDEYKWRICRIWTDALFDTGEPPNMTHRGEYYPLAEHYKTLMAKVKAVRDSGSLYEWLEKSKDDIGPDKTPNLILVPSGEREPGQSDADHPREGGEGDDEFEELEEDLMEELEGID